MKVNVSRHARDLVALLRKLHAPRKRGRFAPAAARGEAALASEEIRDGDAGSTRVRSFPPRQLVTPHQEVAGEHGAEQTAIKHATGAEKIEREKQRRIVAVFG